MMKPRHCTVTIHLPGNVLSPPVTVEHFRSLKKAQAFINVWMAKRHYHVELFCRYEPDD